MIKWNQLNLILTLICYININIAYNIYNIKDICYHTVGKRNILLNKNIIIIVQVKQPEIFI